MHISALCCVLNPPLYKEILLIPSAFSMPTGEAHWELLMRTRAVECQCYVIAAAQACSEYVQIM